jgi:aminomethyltransferase
MVDDATVFRLGRDNLRFIGGCESDGLLLAERARELELRAWVKPVTDELHNLAIQGPASRDTLAPIVWSARRWPELHELRWFRFLVGRIGGPQGVPVVVSRTGYTGELGYEIFCSPRDGLAVWDAVMAAGAGHGIVPLGGEALEMVRIEAGLIRAGHEFGADEDPFEAGIGFTVALDDAEGFTGSEALGGRRDHPRRALVGLRLAGGECPAHGDPVLEGRREVGVVTSAAPSPREGLPLAMARVSTRCASAGTVLRIGRAEGRRRMLDATVCTLPFYDPRKERPRA